MYCVISNAWTGSRAFKVRHSTTVLHCSDCTLRIVQLLMLVCLFVTSLLVSGCFIIQKQRPETQTDEWLGFSISLPLTLTLLSYLPLHPSTLADNLAMALQLAVKCAILKGERKQ